jgi:hypothetical protein
MQCVFHVVELNRYRIRLRAGVRVQAQASDILPVHSIQTGCAVHPASGEGDLSPGS